MLTLCLVRSGAFYILVHQSDRIVDWDAGEHCVGGKSDGALNISDTPVSWNLTFKSSYKSLGGGEKNWVSIGFL